MGQTGSVERVHFAVDIVFHPANRWSHSIEEKIRGSAVAIIGEADTAAIHNSYSADGSNERAMDVAVHDQRLFERSVNRTQLFIGGFRRRSAPCASWTRVYQSQ